MEKSIIEMLVTAAKEDNLYGVPVEKLTPKICETAFNIYYNVFKYLPREYKTYNMCIKAVMNDPYLIKDMPIELLNQEFLNDLKLLHVEIPVSLTNYIQKCLNIHKIFEEPNFPQQQNLDKQSNNEELKLSDDIAQIKLSSFEWLLTPPALNKLELIGIYTVGDLLSGKGLSNFLNRLESDRYIKLQILGAIRLLRCKYLDEDPLIDENDEIDITTISEKFGFSKRTKNCLGNARFNNQYSSNKFFKLMRNYEVREYELSRKSNIGEKVIAEIVNKVQIVLDYHDRHQKNTIFIDDSDVNDNLSLEELNNELLRLKLEMQRITERTDIVLEQVRKKLHENAKGSISK